MELHYYKDAVGNFGDDLNPWLWPQLFPMPIRACADDQTLFIGIGSLLNHRVPSMPPKKIVFGAGCGYGPAPAVTDQWRFWCVRGPLTASALGLPPSAAICDGAVLVRELMEPAPSPGGAAAFMPHHRTSPYDDWRAVCAPLGMRYIDPAGSVQETLDLIRMSSLVITESLHGAIVADAFRVPWIPVRTRRRILGFKWEDFALSLGLVHRFEWLLPAWKKDIDWKLKRAARPLTGSIARARLRWLVRFGERRLSRQDVFDETRVRLRGRFQQLLEAVT